MPGFRFLDCPSRAISLVGEYWLGGRRACGRLLRSSCQEEFTLPFRNRSADLPVELVQFAVDGLELGGVGCAAAESAGRHLAQQALSQLLLQSSSFVLFFFNSVY